MHMASFHSSHIRLVRRFFYAILSFCFPTKRFNISPGLHFYEEVEDTKDCVWVVQVTGYGRNSFMATDDWYQLSRKLGHFGVRTGVFDCQQDIEYVK